jgi:hypothetical protein
MNCYVCDQSPLAGTLRYGIRAAVGVCSVCGIGVCREHSHKAPTPGAPLLCEECARLAGNVVVKPPIAVRVASDS